MKKQKLWFDKLSIILAVTYVVFSFLNRPLIFTFETLLQYWLKPLIVILFLVTTSPAKKVHVTLSTFIYLILSFLPPLFLSSIPKKIPFIIIFTALSNTIFYSGLLFFGYFSLGKNISVIPALKKISQDGTYRLIRHPIYSCYLYLIINFIIIYPTLNNIVLAILFTTGILFRALQEEKILMTNDTYKDYMKRIKCRFIHPFLLFPIILLLGIVIYTFLAQTKKETISSTTIELQLAYPIQSLNPTEYDDWSSVFVGNHIFPRLIPDSQHPWILFVTDKINIKCIRPIKNRLDMKCKVVQINFLINELRLCSGEILSVKQIKNEFFEILNLKNWIFPKWKQCNNFPDKEKTNSQEICIQFPNIADIYRRLENLYFRFGWSGLDIKSNSIGAGPYCLINIKRKKDIITNGILTPLNDRSLLKKIIFFTSQSKDTKFNVALYGHKQLLKNKRKNVQAHTPTAYFVITNSSLANYKTYWNSKNTKKILYNHLLKTEILLKNDQLLRSLVPNGNALSSYRQFNINKSNSKHFILPNYIPDCSILAKKLNMEWKNKIPIAKCMNIQTFYTEFLFKKRENWGGFLFPLSPGAPGRNAILHQYFSNNSNNSLTGKYKNTSELFYLVGLGQSIITVDGETICNIKANSMGVGGIVSSDFIDCSL